MRPGISEFSFGYAFTEEILNTYRGSFVGAPYFPSLYDEGTEGGGFDLRIAKKNGFPIFIQFKLSHEMIRSNAFEDSNLNIMNVPFFRIHLMSSKVSRQHEMLLKLDDGNNEVYYVAPQFSTQSELNNFYTHHTVIQNSFLIKPGSIGVISDGNEHHISIHRNAFSGYLFSKEPRKIESILKGTGLKEIISKRLESDINLEEQTIVIIQRLRRIISESLGIDRIFLEDIVSKESKVELLTYIARFYFDSEVIFLVKG